MQENNSRLHDVANTDLAYMAGLFDGEGMIAISKSWNKGAMGRRPNPLYMLVIKVGMSDKPPLDWIAAKFGGWITQVRVKSDRPHYRWHKKSILAQQVLESILPYLIVKREQAEVAISFQRRQSAHKNRYSLNQIGPIIRSPEEIAYKEEAYLNLMRLKRHGQKKAEAA